MNFSLPGSSVLGDSPAKTTGVSCHFLLQGNLLNPGVELVSLTSQGRFSTTGPPGKPVCVCVSGHACMLSCFIHVRLFVTEEPDKLLCPWDPPGKNTGAGCHALLQGIFPTQGSNWRLFYVSCICRRVLCCYRLLAGSG